MTMSHFLKAFHKRPRELLFVDGDFPDVIRAVRKETGNTGTRITKAMADLYKIDPSFKMRILNALPRKNKRGSIIDFIPFLVLFIVMVFAAIAMIPAIDDFFVNPTMSQEINETQAGN